MSMEMIRMGPIGRSTLAYQTGWDEMGNDIISHIIVSFDTKGVRSIQFGYVNNGALAISKTYGTSAVRHSSRIVRLKHESEFVTGLSMKTFGDNITSLTFHTNQRKHEVVNLTIGSNSKYRSPQKMELHSEILERREFGGFFGNLANNELISIGFYVRLVLPDVKVIKEEKV